MAPIRTRGQLATLLERQMAAASARGAPTETDEIDARTALKTYLYEAHGALRSDPARALPEIAQAAGLELRPTDDSDLYALAQGELSFWLDTTSRRFVRLYTVASVKDADRVHEALVAATPLLDPLWTLPASLEALPAAVGGSAVLFSLRHDRRTLRRPADAPDTDSVDSVTLRFWAPTALETLGRLRASRVLPGATSVHSIRVRAGEPGSHAVVEAFHHGKLTAVGTSFEQHERVVRAALDAHIALADALEGGAPTRLDLAVPWTCADLGHAVAKLFSGAEPFRLWGLPVAVGPQRFVARAVDTGIGRVASFEVSTDGVAITLERNTPAAVVARTVANLQYFVHSEAGGDLSPLALATARPRGAARVERAAFDARAEMDVVARVVLVEACAQWLRGRSTLVADELVRDLLGSERATPATVDLARRVLSEAAAHEWREWLRPILAADGSTQWRWLESPARDTNARTRELVRLNKHAQQLVARVSGGVVAPWLQLSLFDAAALVPAVAEE